MAENPDGESSGEPESGARRRGPKAAVTVTIAVLALAGLAGIALAVSGALTKPSPSHAAAAGQSGRSAASPSSGLDTAGPAGTVPASGAAAASPKPSTPGPQPREFSSCLDKLTVPPAPQAAKFSITATVTCPVPAAQSLTLVAQIRNAAGATEYYLVTGWKINPENSAPQTYESQVSNSAQRTYFLIRTTSDQLAGLTASANTAADGGFYSLQNVVVVSNTQTGKAP